MRRAAERAGFRSRGADRALTLTRSPAFARGVVPHGKLPRKETTLKDRLLEALKSSAADYTEIRYELDDSTGISYRGEEVENVSSSKTAGGIVRACTRGGWGVATFDDPADLAHCIGEAARCAALVGKETTELAETPAADEVRTATFERDFRGVPFDEKLELVRRYNEIVLKADPAIETSHVHYWDRFRTVHFASSRGTYAQQDRPQVGVVFSAVARDGAMVQRAHDGARSAVTYDAVLGHEKLAEQTARRAAALLKAPPCEGRAYTVILDPEMGGVFAHEAFGHLSEADFLYENPRMRDLMHLGRKMGPAQLNIVDDGTLDHHVSTQRFDDEGSPTRKTHLIQEGVLAGHLHSLETAAKMGAEPTGNARAQDRRCAPIVRMTNTYIEAGKLSFEELIAGVDDGIYACGMMGGQTMMEMFTFSAAHGYRIRGGQVGELIRDVVLTGNVFETLGAIDGLGDDMRIIDKGGGCGKGGQSAPVTFGSPHVRIRNVVVGGK